MPLLPVTAAFFASRVLADTFWVWTTGKVSDGLGDVFLDQVTSWQSVAIQVTTIALIVLVFRLPWARWLGGHDRKHHGGSGKNISAQREPARSARKT